MADVVRVRKSGTDSRPGADCFVERGRFGVGVDALDQAGQHLARADLDELGRRPRRSFVRRQRSSRRRGSGARRARHGTHRRLSSSRASALARSGADGSLNVMSARIVRIRSAASDISGECAATLTISTIARLAPSSRAFSAAPSTATRSPLTTTWPGELRFAMVKTPSRLPGRLQLAEALVGEADDCRHRAVWRRCLHLLAAFADEPHTVGEREDAGSDHRAVLAHRVAGVEGGSEVSDRAGCNLGLRERVQVGDRRRQDRRLRVDGQIELVGRTFEAERRDRLIERLIGSAKGGRSSRGGLSERLAHTDVLRTLAGKDERIGGHEFSHVIRANALMRRFTCSHAHIFRRA